MKRLLHINHNTVEHETEISGPLILRTLYPFSIQVPVEDRQAAKTITRAYTRKGDPPWMRGEGGGQKTVIIVVREGFAKTQAMTSNTAIPS